MFVINDNEKIIYRLLSEDDCKEAVWLLREAFPKSWLQRTIYSSSYVENYLKSIINLARWQSNHYLVGAFTEQTMVGFVHGCTLSRYWHLNNIAVKPGYQNQGIGKKLLEEWLEFGRTRSYKYFSLDVDQENFRALRWYEQLGFITERVVYHYEKPLHSRPFGDIPPFQVVGWENAEAWQIAYGFSSFSIEYSGGGWKIDRLGEKYFRICRKSNPDIEAILLTIDPNRLLLIQLQELASDLEMYLIGKTLRMYRYDG